MKIALLQCPGWGRDCPPYTMALLSAIARRAGHKVFCFDLNNALYLSGPDEYRKMWDDKDLYSFWSNEALIAKFIQDNNRTIEFQVERILNSDAKVIGFTVHFSSLLMSLEVAKRIKNQAKDRLIIFGGPDCCRELRGNEMIRNEAVDVVVIGEGDESLLELVDILNRKGKVDFCVGVLIKNNGQVIDCGDREALKDLDSLPFPDYTDFTEDISWGLYRQPERLEILDSRGCITKCHFCSEWQFWKRFRTMSGERIYEEASHQVSSFSGVDYFYFIGSLLNGNVRVLEKFCDLVIQNGLKIRWLGQAIVSPLMTKEILEKMKRSGCEWLGIGIESGSEELVHRMNKRFSLREAERMLQDAHNAGINIQANFMFGMPTETEEDFKKTLEFLKRNRENIDSILASQSFCVIDKGTYLHTHPEEFGIEDEGHHLYWQADKGRNTYPERFRRYEEFCSLAISLGIPEGSGVLKTKPDKWVLLGDYYQFTQNYQKALACYGESKLAESDDESIRKKINLCKEALQRESNVPPSIGHREFLDVDIRIEMECNIDIDKEICENHLNEKQRNIINALYAKGLWKKLSNYISIEKQKASRMEFVEGFPYWLVVDPANFCNLKCPFCPTGQNRPARTKGMLGLKNFERLIDKLGPYLIHVDFCNWGEPLLNKEIFRMIRLAKEYHADTKIDSNFNCLSEAEAEAMIGSGLDKVIVSIDGLSQETYVKYRVGGDFNRAMNNLELLLKKKRELKSKNPYITWQFLVFRHNEHEIEDVLKVGKELGVDHVGITKAFIGDKEWFPRNRFYSHYEERKTTREIPDDLTFGYFKQPEEARCNWLWEASVINPNGSVSPCCSVEDEKEDFGNIFTESFESIWNNEHYRSARRYIREKKEISTRCICMGCRHLGLTNLDIMSCHSFFDAVK